MVLWQQTVATIINSKQLKHDIKLTWNYNNYFSKPYQQPFSRFAWVKWRLQSPIQPAETALSVFSAS